MPQVHTSSSNLLKYPALQVVKFSVLFKQTWTWLCCRFGAQHKQAILKRVTDELEKEGSEEGLPYTKEQIASK